MRSAFALALALIALPTAANSRDCSAGQKDYYGSCVEVKPPSAKFLKFLNGYGRQTKKVGEVADLFAPDLPLFDKPEPGRKLIRVWKRWDADIKSTARIERVLPDFYYVTVSVYGGPTSCGITEFKEKGPIATLRGYVPKANPQGVPSLWQYTHMSGLC